MMMTLSPGAVLGGRYRILEKIGEGGFGVVYKAYDWYRNSLVAIKQINMAALSAQEKIEATDSFNREVTLLSRLNHKSLPRIYNHFTDAEHWYVAMDYIEGRTLEDVLESSPGRRLPLKRVRDIGIALCDVLDYLHAQYPPIIFRDVKPGNIMITPAGQIYLIDFGIARLYRPGQAKDTGPLGSPGYAAPEQYGKAQTTPQTDIYGLGATLQTLLTGKEPLEIRVSGLPPDRRIPWELQALLIRMMEKDCCKRPRDVMEVRRALAALDVSPLRRFKALPVVKTFNNKVFYGTVAYLLAAVGWIFAFILISPHSLTGIFIWLAAVLVLALPLVIFILHTIFEEIQRSIQRKKSSRPPSWVVPPLQQQQQQQNQPPQFTPPIY
jgi:serine/threonine protein kinase